MVAMDLDSYLAPTRCAACLYLNKKCSKKCIFAPYFPASQPQRFAAVHRIFGATNVGRILREVPVHSRANAANSLVIEANQRIIDPVYGCVRIIAILQSQVDAAQQELAMIRAQIRWFEIHCGGLNQDTDPESSDDIVPGKGCL